MREEDHDDKAVRKSKRARVPNLFYTELKPEPKKPLPKKRTRQGEEEEGSLLEGKMELEYLGDKLIPESAWLNCRLPNEMEIKVHFMLRGIEEADRKKEEPQKASKKSEASMDLLSLFQKAIDNVNEEPSKVELDDKYHLKELRPKLQPVKKKRVSTEDEGTLINVSLKDGTLRLTHSKFGQHEVPLDWTPKVEMEDEKEWERIGIYKQKLAESRLLANLAIFS